MRRPFPLLAALCVVLGHAAVARAHGPAVPSTPSPSAPPPPASPASPAPPSLAATSPSAPPSTAAPTAPGELTSAGVPSPLSLSLLAAASSPRIASPALAAAAAASSPSLVASPVLASASASPSSPLVASPVLASALASPSSSLVASPASSSSSPEASATASAQSLKLSALPGDSALAALLWEHSPEFAATRARLASARAELTRAHLLPNPTLDVSMNTIPVGPTNPPGLSRLGDVPNYVFGLSELVELGKRGPRQDSARAALASAALDVQATLRTRTYDVLERAADVAATEVRIAQLEELADDAEKLTQLQRARQERGDAAGLDVDRSVLEEESLRASLGDERSRLTDLLLACTQTAGMPCISFGSRQAAADFLAARLARAPAPARVESRPDLRSLAAQEDSARAELTLARHKWIPDPTVRAGYVRDQFVVSGNQQNSLFVGLSLPLPFFDHGQADAHAAAATLESARTSRTLLAAQATRDAATLTEELARVRDRQDRLRTQTLPLAEGVVQRLDQAVRAGGAALQDLLLARRTYGELLLRVADLDQSAFHLSVGLERASAAGPEAPSALELPRG